MPRKPRQFINGEIYHIVLRRAGNELFFGDIDDYYRGVFYIYECNTTQPITMRERRERREQFKKVIRQIETDMGQTPVKIVKLKELPLWKDERDRLVEVLAFCLMPNHIHLLVRQLKEGGISKFIQKIASGYAAYFKKKYGIKLKGHFFQDRFEAVHIKTDEQLKVVFVYIHTNPISLIEPEWKEDGIEDPEKVIKFLENYKWSSYLDYIGKKNFPSVTEREFILKVMGGEGGCREWVEGWIKHKAEIKKLMKKFSNLALE
jgi:REP element-mobilizing transposase RayT